MSYKCYLCDMNMQLKSIRRGLNIKLQDIKLDNRTINKIEQGDMNVSVSSLQVYCEAIGLQLVIALK